MIKYWLILAISITSMEVYSQNLPTATNIGFIGDAGGFTFDTTGSSTIFGTVLDTELAIWDEAGNLLAQNDDGVQGFGADLISISLVDGTYVLGISRFASFFQDNFINTGTAFALGETGTGVLNVNGVTVGTIQIGETIGLQETGFFIVEVGDGITTDGGDDGGDTITVSPTPTLAPGTPDPNPTGPLPIITVTGRGRPITDLDFTPRAADGTFFGRGIVNSRGASFVIRNTSAESRLLTVSAGVTNRLRYRVRVTEDEVLPGGFSVVRVRYDNISRRFRRRGGAQESTMVIRTNSSNMRATRVRLRAVDR